MPADCSPAVTIPGPYAAAAHAYRAAGWECVLPLPLRAKFPPPAGFTGDAGAVPTDDDVDGWVADHGAGNVALRLPDGLIGLDVDDYADKPGARTLADAEGSWGALPPTVVSTARGAGVSGIRLFRVPLGLDWPGEVGPGIETIRVGHRYMVVAPSAHPDGNLYEWRDAAGLLLTEVPAPQTLPELPAAWVRGLTGGALAQARASVTAADVATFLAGLPSGEAASDVCEALTGLTDGLDGAAVGRHPAMLRAVDNLVAHGAGGAHGVREALAAAREAFLVAKPAGSREFDRALAGSVGRVRAVGAVPHGDRLAFDEGGPPVNLGGRAAPAGRDAHGGDKRAERLTANDIATWVLARYELVRSTDGLLFAVPSYHGSARVAREVRAIRQDVTRRLREERGVVVGRETLTAALDAVESYAADKDPAPVHLRAAQVGDDRTGGPCRIVVDLGDRTGRVVEVTAQGWDIVDPGPDVPLFRRSEATQPLSTPERGGSLRVLRDLLGLSREDPRWALVRGWLVGALFAEIPRPLLWATGPQGSGKSTRAQMILSTLEPQSALGKEPGKSERDDSTAARGRYLVSYDNVTGVSQSTSDFLCRLVTGVTDDRRALYTDDGLRPVAYKRSGVATSLTLPAGLGPDAVERLAVVEFDRIPEGDRRGERAMMTAFKAASPALLGAVLDDVSLVLTHLPAVMRESRPWPRMADFGMVLAALDAGLGLGDDNGHLSAYRRSVGASLADRAHDDPLTAALLRMVAGRPDKTWRGGAEQLLAQLDHHVDDYVDRRGWWPASGRAMRSQVTKASEALRHAGVVVSAGKSNGERWIDLRQVG